MASSSTTPSAAPPNRSTSRSRAQTPPPPRPTTPLRPPSRSSLRSSQTPLPGQTSPTTNPLSTLEAPFGELADSMADLEANFVHLQLLHESLSRFTECFASFLYGLNVNAFCVDFPEAPIPESFRRAENNPRFLAQAQEYASETGLGGGRGFGMAGHGDGGDPDQTFLTTDTSFVENPPASSVKAASSTGGSRFATPRAGRRGAPSTTSTGTARGGRGAASSAPTTTRGGQSARGRSTGLARASTRGRGVGR